MKDRPEERVGDAACVWHTLDASLARLCGVRDDLAGAGLEDLAEGLREPIEEVEARYDEAEREVARMLDGGREEPRW